MESDKKCDFSPEQLKAVIQSILSSARDEPEVVALLQSENGQQAAKYLSKGQLKNAHLMFHHHHEVAWNILVGNATAGDTLATFVAREYDFVARHVRSVIEEAEGGACCVDKTSWLLRKFMNMRASGEPMNLHVERDDAWFSPKMCFRRDELLLEFVHALRDAYYASNGFELRLARARAATFASRRPT